MICPKCKSEYKDGITHCADCDVDLIEDPEKNKPEEIGEVDPDAKFVLLLECGDSVEADLIVNLLKNNDIPCYSKNRMGGSYMTLYIGYSVYGKDIYVNESDYDVAKEICEEVFFSYTEESNQDDEEQKVPFYHNKTIVAKIELGVMAVIVATIWIVNKFIG